MEIFSLILVLIVGIISASFGTLVGGSSLLTIPLLIFFGLPSQVAIATNRLGMTGVTISGLYEFRRKKLINYKIGLLIGIPFFISSIIGANLVLQINEAVLRQVIAAITILTGIIMLLKPNLGLEKTKTHIKKHEYIVTVILAFMIGIYAGFYGAAAGTFLNYVLILVLGLTFLESAGTRKIPFVFSSITSIIIFALSGIINYTFAIALFIGTLIGSYIGAHYCDRLGNVWIRRMFFVLVLVMAIRLLI
jgi:hypothetical protein